MHYLIAGLAKSGTTILFSRIEQALSPAPETYFEPDRDEQLLKILASEHTLTKVLIGRVKSSNELLRRFDRHIVIYRDPRDQFISMLLYLFYDFQVSGDQSGYEQALEALTHKVENPAEHSTIELYNKVAGLVGRAPIAVFDKLHDEQTAYIAAFSPHLLRYEDFVDDKLGSVEHYVKLNLHNDAKVPETYGRVARSKGYGDWKNWLNEQDLRYINSEWGGAITDLGYALERRVPQQLQIADSTSLDYVRQFNPARR